MISLVACKALLAAAALAAPAAHGTRVAVLGLEATGVDARIVDSAGLVIPTEVRRVAPTAQVISTDEVRSMLSFEQEKRALGCTDLAACMAEIGGALGVEEIVAGKLGKLGNQFVFELRRIDARKARVLSSAVRTVPDEDGLLAAIRSAVAELWRTAPGKGDAAAVPASGARDPAADGAAQRRVGYWWLGGAGAAAATAVTFAVLAARTGDAIDAGDYPDATDRSSAEARQRMYRTFGIGFGVAAGVAAAIGAIELGTAPPEAAGGVRLTAAPVRGGGMVLLSAPWP